MIEIIYSHSSNNVDSRVVALRCDLCQKEYRLNPNMLILRIETEISVFIANHTLCPMFDEERHLKGI